MTWKCIITEFGNECWLEVPMLVKYFLLGIEFLLVIFLTIFIIKFFKYINEKEID